MRHKDIHFHLHCNSFLKKIEVPNFHKQETSEKILNNIKSSVQMYAFLFILLVPMAVRIVMSV